MPALPRARSITRPDAVLRGEETGSGPAVLLLHAGGENRRVWTPVTEVLVAAGFRCTAFDQRGHGASDEAPQTLTAGADDVAAMLHAEPPGCLVVGASLGGLTAIPALADPTLCANVAGLVLVDVVPNLEPDRVRRFLTTAGVADRHTVIVDDILARVPQLEQATTHLDLPILLVRGGKGSAVTDEDIARFLRLAPHATVSRIPAAGHLVARDQPVALAETLVSVTAGWPAPEERTAERPRS